MGSFDIYIHIFTYLITEMVFAVFCLGNNLSVVSKCDILKPCKEDAATHGIATCCKYAKAVGGEKGSKDRHVRSPTTSSRLTLLTIG